MIKIALPTGRVQKDAIKVLKSAGVPTNNLEKAS
ncbi:MAG: ATP phosphoribosyltransferase, partial [Synergistaceae bacterium]|nr:ATP phosphoribosyltransferase [Synergistaceae bacterium]